MSNESSIKRFMSYVDKLPNGCWFWAGARSRGKGNKKWYGSFWYRGKTIRAHRFADEVLSGRTLEKGHHRDHTCCFSLCVNPGHIKHETHADNQRLKLERKRGPI